MKLIRFSNTRLSLQPALAAMRSELIRCSGTVEESWGLLIDTDCNCYKEIRSRINHNKKQLISNVTQAWGPVAWKWLHDWALNTKLVTEDICVTLTRFAHRLPCGECREHWFDIVKVHPAPRSNNNKAMFIWTVHRHNDINVMLNKKTMSMQDAMKIWATDKSQQSSKSHPL